MFCLFVLHFPSDIFEVWTVLPQLCDQIIQIDLILLFSVSALIPEEMMNPEIEEMETLPREFDFAGIQPEDEVDDDEDMYYEVDENDLANNEGDRDYYEA